MVVPCVIVQTVEWLVELGRPTEKRAGCASRQVNGSQWGNLWQDKTTVATIENKKRSEIRNWFQKWMTSKQVWSEVKASFQLRTHCASYVLLFNLLLMPFVQRKQACKLRFHCSFSLHKSNISRTFDAPVFPFNVAEGTNRISRKVSSHEIHENFRNDCYIFFLWLFV